VNAESTPVKKVPLLEIRNRIVLVYYLATPGFYILNLLIDVNLRAHYFEASSALIFVYHLLCFGLGIVMYRIERMAPILGLIESAVGVFLLVYGVFGTYLQSIEMAAEGVSVTLPFAKPEWVWNFGLSGAVLVLCFYGNPLFQRVKRA